MRQRKRAWFVQGYNCMFFIRYRCAWLGRCGHPQLYAIHRNWWNAIGGEEDNRIRWHLRHKTRFDWAEYRQRITNLCFAMIYRKSGPADGMHKGSPPPNENRKLKAKTENRAGFRRFLSRAVPVQDVYRSCAPDLPINLVAWAALRLQDGHLASEIIRCLRHALEKFAARFDEPCENYAGWILGVAFKHLEYDGLTPYIRWREKERKGRQAADAAAFNEKMREAERRKEFWDREERYNVQRQLLYPWKPLPSGGWLRYNVRTGNYEEKP